VPRPKKKRRIVSAATVDSEDESNRRGITEEMLVNREWPIHSSDVSCVPCSTSGKACWSFIRRLQGRPRNACVNCYRLKKRCNLADERRRAQSVSRPRGRDEEDDDKEPLTGQKPTRPSKPIGKARTRDRSKSEGKRMSKGKGKGKGKELGKGKGKNRAETETETETDVESDEPRGRPSVKTEDDDGAEWHTGECFLIYLSYR
jgi:hypothetical protein